MAPYVVAPAVAHLGRAGQLNHHLRVVVAVAVGRLRHLELVLAQQNREDRLDLHGGERGADAAVPARAERDPRPPIDDVGLLGLVVAVRVERVGVGEVLGDPVADRRGGGDEVALVDREALDLELALGDPHQDDQRRVQPQGLLDDVVQLRNLAQRMETHLLAVGVELLELGDAPRRRPRGGGSARSASTPTCRNWCGARRTSAR